MHVLARFLVAVLLATVAIAQSDCQKCAGEACLPCEFHTTLRKAMDEYGMFLGWGDKVPCCHLTAVVPCKTCLPADELRRWMPPQRRSHQEHLGKVWYDEGDKNKSVISTRSIADLIKHLGGDVVAASTKHFFLVTNAAPVTLNRGAFRSLQPELKKAAELLPGLVDPQRTLIQREHWAILYLLRCEQLRREYWSMLGVESPPAWVERAGRIEAFVLHGEPAGQAFVSFHDGASRRYRGIERFLCKVVDSNDFPGDDLPADRHGHTLLAHYIAAGLTDRLVHVGAAKAPRYTPWFLELGLGHVLEARTSGKVVYRGASSEAARGAAGSWHASDWAQRMHRLVGKPKAGAASAAPTFAQLSAVDAASANFDHHLAAWSLMSFLLLQPGDGRRKVYDYLLAVRQGATAVEGLKQVYDLDGPKLTTAWHAWVRDNPRQLLAPAKPLQSARGEEMMANFETVMATKKAARTSNDEHMRSRLAAIGNLRWAEPREQAVRHLLTLMRTGTNSEATVACDTLRADEMEDALVASMLWTEVDDALDQAADLRYRIHLVRAAGTQQAARQQFLPALHKAITAPGCPTEVATAIATTLGELADPTSQPVLEAATRSPQPLVRAEGATALAQLSSASALSRARELINDPSWHVRIASIAIFRRIATSECVPVLFTRLPFENGRLAEDITSALLAITGLKAPFEAAAQWKHWWDTGGKESLAANKRSAATTVSTDTGGDSFPPILSKRFLFLIDVSSSMSQSVFLKPKPRTTTATTADGLIATTKLRFVTEKLTKIVGNPNDIPDDVIFDIAFFATTTTQWKRDLVKATPENRASAAQFLAAESRSQESTTDLQRALAAGLQQADVHLDKGEYEAALDTIYLITDGSPTAGEWRDPELLRTWFREANRNHRIKIYVITVGATDTDLTFLTRLAAENYGPPPVIVRRE